RPRSRSPSPRISSPSPTRSSVEGADRLAVGAAQLSLAQPSGLVRRARGLAWLGIGWHVVEFGIAIGAGIAASSIALSGFGADSLVESLAGLVVVWRFGRRRGKLEAAERRAQQIPATTFLPPRPVAPTGAHPTPVPRH